ncbi:MAG: ABC transporter permease [Ruminococcaceae bacterium]|nr:ABC transporter permease [Oscillospiraceae bacterium]
MPDVTLSRDFKERLIEAIQNGQTEFSYTDASLIVEEDEAAESAEGEGSGIETDDESTPEGTTPVSATAEYTITHDPLHHNWSVRQEQVSRQYDSYSQPNSKHWLGTDKYGMDMLTRLMYGGRVSLLIGFIVVIIETVIGVIFGGISGYFGGWVDNLIMRIVDIFYCIPSMPIIIILGAAMDAQRVDPTIRMVYLMLILGFLGWAGIARLVRGQILSLREQEYMTATEACGISVSHRIFRHLIPNVIPQLIVNCTMGLGSVIIMEATLSFLGLGVKFPFASWGNIINDVNNTHVLTNYWFIWIPAGTLLLLTVLAFNLVGDGLRDAFDPKMKR